jgi:hypothetical protein
MYKMSGLILLALTGLLLLPHFLYFLLWLITGRGLHLKSEGQLEHTRNLWRPEQIWALRTVGIAAIGVGLYRVTVFFWAR